MRPNSSINKSMEGDEGARIELGILHETVLYVLSEIRYDSR